MRELTGVRYATPLREGGSLPAIVETETGELFVVKFPWRRPGTSGTRRRSAGGCSGART